MGDYKDSLVGIMLEFVRAAVLEREPTIHQYMKIDWDVLMDMSAEQGLLAWVWDGICKLPTELQPPRQQRINWGLSAQGIWSEYDHQESVLKELVAVCKQHNMRLLLLKGIGLSEMYPNPHSRPSGDIDIYLFGDYEKGNRILANGTFDFSNKHSVFDYRGVKIENHQNFFYHGTRLQIDVDNYLFSAISECDLSKDGYYVLPMKAGLVHILLHSMVHLNNPSEHITLKNIVDFACYLLFHNSKLNPKECGCLMRELNLERAFDLFIQLSEWLLSMDFSEYQNELEVKSGDFNKAVTLLLDGTLRCPQFDNYSFTRQLRQRISYYYNTGWRYKYLPNWKRLNQGFVKKQVGYFIKSILGKPFDTPLLHPSYGKHIEVSSK